MKRLLIIASLLFVTLVFPLYVFAQTDEDSETPTTRREELRQQQDARRELFEVRRDQLRQRISDRRATRSAQLEEARKERIRHFFSLITRRMNAAISRLERLIERIESRLAKFEEENPDIDTATIHQDIENAEILLDEAKANLDAAQASLEDVLASQNPKDAFGIIRETISEVKNQLKEVHSILVHTIGDIKGLRVGEQ